MGLGCAWPWLRSLLAWAGSCWLTGSYGGGTIGARRWGRSCTLGLRNAWLELARRSRRVRVGSSWPGVRQPGLRVHLLVGLVHALVVQSRLSLVPIRVVSSQRRCTSGSKGQRSSDGSGWRWPRRREKWEGEGEVGEREGEGREKVRGERKWKKEKCLTRVSGFQNLNLYLSQIFGLNLHFCAF